MSHLHVATRSTSETDGSPAQTLLLPDDPHNRALVENVHPSAWAEALSKKDPPLLSKNSPPV